MNMISRIFSYPSRNLFMSMGALLGLSVCLLIDSGEIEKSFLITCFLFFPTLLATFIAEDMLTIFSKAKNTQTLSMIHLKMSKLQRNIILGICLFLILTYLRFNFYDFYAQTSYKNSIMFLFMTFQLASLLIAFRA